MSNLVLDQRRVPMSSHCYCPEYCSCPGRKANLCFHAEDYGDLFAPSGVIFSPLTACFACTRLCRGHRDHVRLTQFQAGYQVQPHPCPNRCTRRVSALARRRAREAKELARDRILNPDKYKRVHRYMRGEMLTWCNKFGATRSGRGVGWGPQNSRKFCCGVPSVRLALPLLYRNASGARRWIVLRVSSNLWRR